MTEILTLPFRAEQFSFQLSTRASAEEEVSIDLACVCFDLQGSICDSVHSCKPNALEGAIIRTRDNAGDDIITVKPKQIAQETCEAMLIVASAAALPIKANDLNCSSKLSLIVSYEDDGEEKKVEVDLKQHVSAPTAYCSPRSNGHQSMVVCSVYLDQAGWIVRWNFTSLPYDNYGAFVREMKEIVHELESVGLSSAKHVVVKEDERIAVTRKLEDRSLVEASNVRRVADEPSTASKLRIDIGWATHLPDEELENCDVQFNLVMYDLQGEEVQAVTMDNTEGDGVEVTVDPDPEEEEEEEAAEEEEKEEEDEENEEGEGGEGGEGEAAKEPEDPPPEVAQKLPPVALKHHIKLDMATLPKNVQSIVLLMTNYGGDGFAPIRSMVCKMFDVSLGETEDKQWCIAEYVITPKKTDKEITQAVVFKLYKQYDDAAHTMWSASSARDVAEFVSQAPKDIAALLKTRLAAFKARKEKEAAQLKELEEAGEDTEEGVDLRSTTWRYSVPALMLGGDGMEAVEHDIKNVQNYDGPLTGGTARTCNHAKTVFANGDSYFGGYDEDLKHGPGIYAFANGAVYVGEYLAGKRDGNGVMIMPDGGVYEGEFKNDKFDGQGEYRYPDGSCYTGSFVGGKKHGAGVYWDTAKGCLQGTWEKGVLKGAATYDQPALHFQGNFVKNVPAGACTYTACTHRTLDMPKFAAAHILTTDGPTLVLSADYQIPPGSEYEPPEPVDGEDAPADDGEERPAIPIYPNYTGLTFSTAELPASTLDLSFPPASIPVKVPGVAEFNVKTGLVLPAAVASE